MDSQNPQVKLSQFKSYPAKVCCQACDTPVKELSTVKIATYDCSRRYTNSKRPFINNYECKCCEKCFKRVMHNILNTVYEK